MTKSQIREEIPGSDLLRNLEHEKLFLRIGKSRPITMPVRGVVKSCVIPICENLVPMARNLLCVLF
jgi:hypothetical protein